jgi:hypothetical protein
MGLKGYRLWVMGQLDSICGAPPRRMDVITLFAAVESSPEVSSAARGAEHVFTIYVA